MLFQVFLLVFVTLGFQQVQAYEVEKLEAGKTLELLEANIRLPAAMIAERAEPICLLSNNAICTKAEDHFNNIVDTYFVAIFVTTFALAMKETPLAKSDTFKSELDELIKVQQQLEKKLSSALIFSVDDTLSKLAVKTVMSPGMATGLSGRLSIPVTKRNESTIDEVYVSTRDTSGRQLRLNFLMAYIPGVMQVKIEDIVANCEQRIAAYRIFGRSVAGDETRLRCHLQDKLGTILFRVLKTP